MESIKQGECEQSSQSPYSKVRLELVIASLVLGAVASGLVRMIFGIDLLLTFALFVSVSILYPMIGTVAIPVAEKLAEQCRLLKKPLDRVERLSSILLWPLALTVVAVLYVPLIALNRIFPPEDRG